MMMIIPSSGFDGVGNPLQEQDGLHGAAPVPGRCGTYQNICRRRSRNREGSVNPQHRHLQTAKTAFVISYGRNAVSREQSRSSLGQSSAGRAKRTTR
jgi:hypothetical protein